MAYLTSCPGLSSTNFISESGFFIVLSLEDNTNVLYKSTNEYNKESERGISWNDPEIGIKWPLDNPLLSDKDKKHPVLKDADINFNY